MNDAAAKAIDYLRPRADAFWQWADGGEAVAFRTSETITFRAELRLVLERLAANGLPPLEPVLLLLAATRGENCLRALGGNFTRAYADLVPHIGAAGLAIPLVVRTLLQRIADLPAELRSTPFARGELIDVVVAGQERPADRQTAQEVVRLLSQRLPEEVLWTTSSSTSDVTAEAPGRHFVGAMRYLREGLERIDADALRARLETGLDTELYQLPVDVPPPQLARSLIAQWQDDEELGGVARLAKQVLAALSVPRPLLAPEEMPEGGVSDLTNRGPLDRLLLSELAHDNLTLAVRVAMNEALYLRREQPPSPPPRSRSILLENGLRSWGVPRVLAAAVALALVASAERGTPAVSAYRAEGPDVVPVDLLSRKGAVAHLACLQPEVHPGPALKAFGRLLDSAEEGGEVFLVVAEDVFADADFQRDLAESELLPAMIATVGRAGEFTLRTCGLGNSRILNRARLDVNAAHRPSEKVPPLIDPARPRGRPAICSVQPFPLLLPHAIDAGQAWNIRGLGVVTATNDRRLTLWTEPDQGPRQLLDDLPPGKLLSCLHHPAEGYERAALDVVVDDRQQGAVHRLSMLLPEGGGVRLALPDLPVNINTAVQKPGYLLVIGDAAVLYESANCQYEAAAEIPAGLVWQHDRFFQASGSGRWFVLGFDLKMEPVDCRRAEQLLTVVRCPGREGFIGLTPGGTLVSTADDVLPQPLRGPYHYLRVAHISRDGSRIGVQFQHRPDDTLGGYCIDLRQGSREPNDYGGDFRAAVEGILPYVTAPRLVKSVTAVGVSAEGDLILTNTDEGRRALTFDPTYGVLSLRPRSLQANCERRCQHLIAADDRGFTLYSAVWPSGDAVVWDSRGLLHLKPADGTLPEVSIAVHLEKVGGWTSTGTLWGNRYFTGVKEDLDKVRQVYEKVLRPFGQRLSC